MTIVSWSLAAGQQLVAIANQFAVAIGSPFRPGVPLAERCGGDLFERLLQIGFPDFGPGHRPAVFNHLLLFLDKSANRFQQCGTEGSCHGWVTTQDRRALVIIPTENVSARATPAPRVERPGTIRRRVSGISRQAKIRSPRRSVGVGIGLVGLRDLDYSPASHDQLRTGAMDYHLKPVGKICAHGGEPLEPSTVCVSVLIERDGELLRLDYCEADWQGPPEGTVGQWRCTVPEPVVSSVLTIDPDSLMRYFERLADEPDDPAEPFQQKLRYVVAVMLWRKRRLKLGGSKMEGDREVLEFSGVRGEGQFDVLDCKLADDEIDELQDRLNEQLQREEWS